MIDEIDDLLPVGFVNKDAKNWHKKAFKATLNSVVFEDFERCGELSFKENVKEITTKISKEKNSKKIKEKIKFIENNVGGQFFEVSIEHAVLLSVAFPDLEIFYIDENCCFEITAKEVRT